MAEGQYRSALEGDHVRGLLHVPGVAEVEMVGEATIMASVEDWAVNLSQARLTFHWRCKTEPEPPRQEWMVVQPQPTPPCCHARTGALL